MASDPTTNTQSQTGNSAPSSSTVMAFVCYVTSETTVSAYWSVLLKIASFSSMRVTSDWTRKLYELGAISVLGSEFSEQVWLCEWINS
nr:hypothetical protein CFP56_61343 [Quercus suber]